MVGVDVLGTVLVWLVALSNMDMKDHCLHLHSYEVPPTLCSCLGIKGALARLRLGPSHPLSNLSPSVP